MLQDLDAGGVAGTYAAGERILVAISEQPGADALARPAKRLADGLNAPWTAVHIETPRSRGLDEAAPRRVAAALGPAATPGATIATLPAANVIVGLNGPSAAQRETHLARCTYSGWRVVDM